MSGMRAAVPLRRRAPARRHPIRLDLLANPYGPSIAAVEAIAAFAANRGRRPSVDHLRTDLGDLAAIPPDRLLLANGVDELLSMILNWRRGRGPLVVFPPNDPTEQRRARRHGVPVIAVHRAPSFALELEPDLVAELPPEATALVGSPGDPTGALLGPLDAVRLARAFDLVVVDERHVEYSGRTLLPLVREFDNLLVLQTLETWAGLAEFPVAYVAGSPHLLAELAELAPRPVAATALVAAEATLGDLPFVRATVRRVREERGRLYRTLRKLNLARPFPSHANFLLARVERGDAAAVQAALRERDVWVHRPEQPGLERFLRISAGLPEETDALRDALIAIAADVP